MSLVAKVKEIVFKALPGINTFTFRDKVSKEHYAALKRDNKLYSQSARAIREAAIKNKGNVRSHLRFLKTVEGQKARLYHVALCFLRGKRYSQVESNVDKNNRLKKDDLIKFLQWRVKREYYPFLEQDIQKFLEG